MIGEFRAGLVDDLSMTITRLHVVQRIGGDELRHLMSDGSWLTTSMHEATPLGAGLTLPRDAIDAIAEAFHPRAGHQVEVDRLVEALEVERRRVDLIIDRATADETDDAARFVLHYPPAPSDDGGDR